MLTKHGISSTFKPANTISQHLFKLRTEKDISRSADATYKIGCKKCPKSYMYIGETATPLYVWLKDHSIETSNIIQGWAYTRNKRKETTDTYYKSALTEHAATSNHVIVWDILGKC